MLSASFEDGHLHHRYAATQRAVSGLRELAYVVNASTEKTCSIQFSPDTIIIVVGSSNAGNCFAIPVIVATTERASNFNPAIVTKLLQADAAPPEATFTNVIDMMEWLDRD